MLDAVGAGGGLVRASRSIGPAGGPKSSTVRRRKPGSRAGPAGRPQWASFKNIDARLDLEPAGRSFKPPSRNSSSK
jgi:hypothetical protein